MPITILPDDESLFIDDFLARRARGLDEAYRAFGPMLFALARHVLGDREDAADCVHDTLVRVWQRPGAYAPDRGTLRAYLATCVRNEALGRMRTANRRRAIEAALPRGDVDPGDEIAMSDPIERANLRRALAELPADQRTALELAYFGHLTQREIADRLNVPLGTVKSRVAHGLRKLGTRIPSAQRGTR
jgi:RNA polymerase sigma-70 factor (ECF subfamily)